jgi:arylsulfatase A-like enzyme
MLFMIVEGRWKYIHHLLKPEESELYDLDADPGETNNLHSSHPDRAQRMLENLLARDAIPDSSGETHGLSEEDLERLRSLGYVQ